MAMDELGELNRRPAPGIELFQSENGLFRISEEVGVERLWVFQSAEKLYYNLLNFEFVPSKKIFPSRPGEEEIYWESSNEFIHYTKNQLYPYSSPQHHVFRPRDVFAQFSITHENDKGKGPDRLILGDVFLREPQTTKIRFIDLNQKEPRKILTIEAPELELPQHTELGILHDSRYLGTISLNLHPEFAAIREFFKGPIRINTKT